MKKPFLILGLLILLAVAWYLVSPLWRASVLDEASPLEEPRPGSMEALSPEEREQFEIAMTEVWDQTVTMEESRPTDVSLLSLSAFLPSAHEVAGTALLIQKRNQKILRFENFETINGPNLHIYLSADLEGNDYIDLGAIRATKGNVNYEIPEGTDTEKYRHVLVWCEPFSVLFSYASL